MYSIIVNEHLITLTNNNYPNALCLEKLILVVVLTFSIFVIVSSVIFDPNIELRKININFFSANLMSVNCSCYLRKIIKQNLLRI